MSEHVVTPELVRRFALLSGDHNPLHVDAVAARRLVFGRPVAHGVLLVLLALDRWLAERAAPSPLERLQASFARPLPVDERFAWQAEAGRSGDWRLRLQAGRARLATLRCRFAHAPWPEPAFPAGAPLPPGEPDEPAPAALADAAGTLPLGFDPRLAERLFPDASRYLPARQLAVLLASTRLVGMECPGLHSVIADLDLAFEPPGNAPAQLAYRVADVDERFGRLSIAVRGPGVKGGLGAFVRPRPQEQPAFRLLRARVETNAFSDQRALIVGGSRGLGEVVAKLLAAGGADVRLTFRVGGKEAAAVVDDIVAGGGRAEALRLESPRHHPTRPAFSATPGSRAISTTSRRRPSRARSAASSRRRCSRVSPLVRTVELLRASGGPPPRVLWPSSVFVDELPADMGEYAAAKAAGETLCRFLERRWKGMTIDRPRLPRLATDQTTSLYGPRGDDPAAALLPVLLRMAGR